MRPEAIAPYAPVLIKLFQQIVYHDDTGHWDMLLRHQSAIAEYVEKMGLALFIDEGEGYAYLHQPELDDPLVQALPRLTRRNRLGYSDTLLCALLRERLQTFDTYEPDAGRLILSADQIREMLIPFFRVETDEVKQRRNLDQIINRVADLGFLKRLTSIDDERYEVRRILKAKITADKLAEIREKLRTYAEPTA